MSQQPLDYLSPEEARALANKRIDRLSKLSASHAFGLFTGDIMRNTISLPPSERWDIIVRSLGEIESDDAFLDCLSTALPGKHWPSAQHVKNQHEEAHAFLDYMLGYLDDIAETYLDEGCFYVTARTRALAYDRDNGLLLVAAPHTELAPQDCVYVHERDDGESLAPQDYLEGVVHLINGLLNMDRLHDDTWRVLAASRSLVQNQLTSLFSSAPQAARPGLPK